MKRTSILLLLYSFFITASFSQSYRINHYTVAQGLSQSVIYALFQDNRGFIWVGTQDGLNRFDGYTFLKYIHLPSDTNSLSDSWVYSIDEDREGNLWIGTRKGLCKFNYTYNNFKRYPHAQEYKNDPYVDNVYGCAVAADGKVYTNTPPLLNYLNPKTGKYTHFLNSVGLNPNVEEQSLPIIIDSEGIIWAATTFGLTRFDPKSERFTNFQCNSNDIHTIGNNNILSMYDDNDRIWVGTPSGIDVYDKNLNLFFRNPIVLNGSSVWVRSIVRDQKGFYWAGTQGFGLLKLNYENGHLSIISQISSKEESSSYYLNSSIVNSLIIDRSQNLWIGTLNGLDKSDLKDLRFQLFRKSSEITSVDLLDNVIASIYKDNNGNIWVGNWGKGLNIINRYTKEVLHYSSSLSGKNNLLNDYVHVIFEYKENEIWIGTRDGIFVYQNKRFVRLNDYYMSYNLPNLSNKRIFCILKDNFNNIWIGTQGGLYYLDFIKRKYKCFISSGEKGNRVSDNLIYSLAIDFNNNLWIATKNGLDKYSFKDNQITNYNRDESSNNTLCDNYINSLCYSSDSSLWIGTKSGINCLNIKNNIFKYYSEVNGLASNTVYEIVEDASGGMWFSTGKGLSHLKKGETQIKNYSEEDGLQGNEFNLKACYRSKDGEIFFGGMNGFNSFKPQELFENKSIPSIVFTSLQKQNTRGTENIYVANNGKVTLNHDDFSFNVEFSALEYTNAKKNMYAYRFDGKSSDWIEIGNRRVLTFSSLSPGNHKLRVKGSNDDGVWNEVGTSITITVIPPWWQTKLAYTIYLVLIFFTIIFLIKFREKRLIEQKRVLEQKVKERTIFIENQKEELQTQKNELQLANATKDKFFNIIAHDLRNPFNVLLGYADLLIEKIGEHDFKGSHEFAKIIYQSSSLAFDLLENLLTWSRSQTGKISFKPENIDLKAVIDTNLILLKSSAEKKGILLSSNLKDSLFCYADKNMILTVLRNLITNSIKFSRKGDRITIDTEYKPECITVHVSDTGVGINDDIIGKLFKVDESIKTEGTAEEHGTGLGLILCKEFVEWHKGKIWVESKIGLGSRFSFTLPKAILHN